jgi:hypothetical protein
MRSLRISARAQAQLREISAYITPEGGHRGLADDTVAHFQTD